MSIDTPKVSIVTLLGERSSFIPLVKYCVDYQTYPTSHLEWIILDDDLTFDLDPIICQKDHCHCGTDIIIPKHRSYDGL